MHKQLDKHQAEKGFHAIGLILILVVMAVIGFIGYKVMNGGKSKPAASDQAMLNPSPQTEKPGPPNWQYNQQKLEWAVMDGAAPKCKDPFTFDRSPVEMSKVTAIGLPGAYRGFNYKAHGGMRLIDATNGKADIVLPLDANLRAVKRYYESAPGSPAEIQYLIDFESDCGIAYRFDHLQTLTPAMQAIADKTPPPKLNDTSGNPNTERLNVPMKSGEVIATAVGFPRTRNYGFDFGVYDYRQRNEISKNKQWAAIHQQFSASAFHGVCWIPLLPAADAAKAEAIAKDRNNYNLSKPFNLTSDYCEFAPHKTLEFNKGQPIDG